MSVRRPVSFSLFDASRFLTDPFLLPFSQSRQISLPSASLYPDLSSQPLRFSRNGYSSGSGVSNINQIRSETISTEEKERCVSELYFSSYDKLGEMSLLLNSYHFPLFLRRLSPERRSWRCWTRSRRWNCSSLTTSSAGVGGLAEAKEALARVPRIAGVFRLIDEDFLTSRVGQKMGGTRATDDDESSLGLSR